MDVQGYPAPIARSGRKAVMSDVARLAGVSHQTVSRVVNGSASVRPHTREVVLAAMAALGYRPNPIARALVTGRTHTLGVVSFDTTLYGPASTLCGIERAAHEAGYFVIIVSLESPGSASVIDATDRLRRHGVDGILAIVSEDDAADALLDARADVPLVAVEAGPAEGIPIVAVDQGRGVTLAVRHLLGLGHGTVHHIGGPSSSIEAQQRSLAWRSVLEETGAIPPPPLIGDWSPRSGYRLGRQLAVDPAVSAIFVANDQMAIGVLRALQETGRRVPEDVSLVGFDDIPEAAFLTPTLTTVRQDFAEVGRRSLRVLVAAIEAAGTGGPPPTGSFVAPELVIRASSGPAARH